jgi:hypothetical protein
MTVGAESRSETLNFYQAARLRIPGDSIYYIHHHVNLRSYYFNLFKRILISS